MRNSSKTLLKYCQLEDRCRRDYLFADFLCYIAGTVSGCQCCDICAKTCVCGSCTDYLINFVINT